MIRQHAPLFYSGTTAERTAFTPVKVGTLWFDTDDTTLYYWSGSMWKSGGGGGGSLPLPGIALYDDAGNLVNYYDATSAGFDDALGDCSAGYTLYVASAIIADNHSIPTQVHIVGLSRYATIFTGKLSLGVSSSLENLSVTRSANSADVLLGVDAPSSGIAYITNCKIVCNQAGSGNAHGVAVQSNGNLEIWTSHIEGQSGSGSGYGGSILGGSGSISHYGGKAIGSTGPYKESP